MNEPTVSSLTQHLTMEHKLH